ncbi:unnamed protein product [Rotaria sordida]|uniref:Uncharacterized protein n=1 Tax=Rotaria sordida TaxID=392033 RepID=A0A818ZK16_9BILA|nr:unnamed protein product [Rotaria sordida]
MIRSDTAKIYSFLAVTETTSELRTNGIQKTSVYSSSANNIINATKGQSATRRSHLFTNNRVQPTTERNFGAHLPSIRDAAGPVERQNQFYDGLQTTPRSKTPLTNTSPKSLGRPASASMSSIFNTLAKRSTENFMTSNGDIDELILPSSHQSRRPTNESNKYGTGNNQTTTIKETIPSQKHSIDNGGDNRYSINPYDNNQQQQQQQQHGSILSNRIRSAVPNVHVEVPYGNETITKERTNTGQLYQRRTNNNIKAPIKQKIDKFRRRSEEVTHATNGNILTVTANVGLSATTPTFASLTSTHLKPPPPSPIPVRRVTSDAEIQNRIDVLRLSMNSNLVQIDQQQRQQQQQPQHQQQNSRNRLKSPYLYSTHQQLAPPPTPQVILRRSQLNSNDTNIQHRQNNAINYRRLQQSSVKQSTNTNQASLYLAFIASRNLSSLEDAQFEHDIDHSKLLSIFSWLKNVEEHRHQQLNHDKLIIEQNQRMLNQEDDLSLYSEIQYAVDDIPANTSGKPCEKIATMQFED